MRALVKQEVNRDFATAGRDVIERAKDTQDRADRLQTWVGVVSTGWLAVVTILFLLILFIGWQEIGVIRTAEGQAQILIQEARAATLQVAQSGEQARESAVQASKSADKINELEGEVSKASQRISAIDRAVASSVSRTVARMPELIEIIRDLIEKGLSGDAPTLPTLDVVALFEEADILIVVADGSNSVERSLLVGAFIALGYY